MPGFVFSLESLLGLREKIEEQKELEYGKAIAYLDEQIKKQEALINEQNGLLVYMKSNLKAKLDPKKLIEYSSYIDILELRIEYQTEQVNLAEQAVIKKRNELTDAVKERKMLDKLKEYEKNSYDREILLKEQKATDELVSYKYSSNRRLSNGSTNER